MIGIDMQYPTSCNFCPFYYEDADTHRCEIKAHLEDDVPGCPLIDLEDDKK